MTAVVKIIWTSDQPEGLLVPEECGTPLAHQLASTPMDNIIELASRTCYESIGQKNSRASAEYHAHIEDVQHLSVREHPCITFETTDTHPHRDIGEICAGLIGRPGIYVRTGLPDRMHQHLVRITANARALCEWDAWRSDIDIPGVQLTAANIGPRLAGLAQPLMPLAMKKCKVFDDPDSSGATCTTWRIVPPQNDDELNVSWYLEGISRGLTHEHVRHRLAAISQRSTRYVQESESPWIWHPLLHLDPDLIHLCEATRSVAAGAYDTAVTKLQAIMKDRGVDATTARKQARGAARGLLGNALETKMVWTSSIAELKWYFHLRAADPADAEIRNMAVAMFKEAAKRFPERFAGWTLRPAADGMGECVEEPKA